MVVQKFPVLEMFCSIQGEGYMTGEPSIFVRVAGCNLRCVFGDSRCDTPYSSFELEKPQWDTVDAVVDEFNKLAKENPNVTQLVITGGEPMLYKDQIKEFIEKLPKGFYVTIETNGTLEPIEPWEDSDFLHYIDLWSISPKLSTSVDKDCKYLTPEKRDHHDKIRINIGNLVSYFISMNKAQELNNKCGFPNDTPTVQLKFVYSGKDSIDEIEQILGEMKLKYPELSNDIDSYVLLMPEGTTNDQLNNISQECVAVCIQKGWRFCDRLHIRIWGDKRGV